MEKKFKVYISDYDYGNIDIEKSILEPIGAEVIGLHDNTGKKLAANAADADAIIEQYAKIPRETIEQLKNCKIIARYGIGVDIVDVDAAYEHGMVVTNVPDYCLDEVADQAAAYSMMLVRNIPFYNAKVHEGSYRWQDWRAPIRRCRDAYYGFLGFGRIGQNLARKMAAFGFKLIASESRLRALNLFSPQIVVEKGFVCYCAPKMGPGNKRYRPISAVRIFAALRFLNLDDLKEIRGEQTFREKAHKDIRFLLEVLETDKNLFLFFPYNMSFNDEGSFEEGLDIALTGIGRDFHNSLLYRSEVCPNRDTYFCFVYAKHFIISVWVDEALRFLDAIPMQKSPLFMKLIDYVDAMY